MRGAGVDTVALMRVSSISPAWFQIVVPLYAQRKWTLGRVSQMLFKRLVRCDLSSLGCVPGTV